MLDSNDKFSIFVRDTHGTGAIAFDSKGRLLDSGTYHMSPSGKVSLVAGNGQMRTNEGRLYVTSGNSGIQVFSTEGKFLGVIPLPRSASSCAFSGPNKKVLYAKGAGMKSPNSTEYRTPEGVRNNAKAIYKVEMIAQGFLGVRNSGR
jgi:hypothetical protein